MNVDFNYAFLGSEPDSSYGAAGLSGVWNRLNIQASSLNSLPLVDLAGGATAATINGVIPNAAWTSLGPWSGNDNRLMEDWMVTTAAIPVGQIQLSGLQAGNYGLLLYGMNAVPTSTTFTVNSSSKTISGAWTGSQLEGQSYCRFDNVSIIGGDLAVSYSGSFNGFQLVRGTVPEPTVLAVLAPGLCVLLRRRKLSR